MFRGSRVSKQALLLLALTAGPAAVQAAPYYNLGSFWRAGAQPPLVLVPASDVWTYQDSQEVSGICPTGVSSVLVYVDGFFDGQPTCSSGTFTYSVSRFTDAAYVITTKGQTAAGLTKATLPVTWTRDTVNPGDPTITSPTSDTSQYGNWLDFTGTCDTGPGGDLNLGSYRVEFLNSGVLTGETPCLSNGTYAGRMNIFVDGTYNTLTVRSRDRAGNYSGEIGSFITWTRSAPPLLWLGAQGTPHGLSLGTDPPVSGYVQGMMNTPSSVAEGTDGYLYVADRANHRINRYDVAGGSYTGSIGNVATPGGGFGPCTAVGPTNAWCTEAKLWSGGYDPGSFYYPTFVVFKNVGGTDYLFVLDVTGRIQKIDAASGAVVEWIGAVWIPPTGGAAGCTSAVYGDTTPGWCTGGWGTAISNGIGGLASPWGLAIDSTYIYAADTSTGKINRYDLVTGAFAGWIGRIQTSPTGPGAPCTGAAVGTFTPDWCTDGNSETLAPDIGDGQLLGPYGIDSDDTYLYVADFGYTGVTVGNVTTYTYHSRVVQFDAATGAFIGWTGEVGTTPTGPDAPCQAANPGDFTPEWCTGGSSTSLYNTAGDGFTEVLSVKLAGGDLYAADNGGYRIFKLDPSTGSDLGWMGSVYTQPTGGPGSCTSLSAGDFTPGFCTGGSASTYDTPGTFDYFNGPYDMAIDVAADRMYTVSGPDSRILKHFLFDGTYNGWIGSTPAGSSGWRADTTAYPVATPLTGADGWFANPQGVTSDGTFIYVADTGAGKIQRAYAGTGQPWGWIGDVNSGISWGDPGCDAFTPFDTFTPGWCHQGYAYANNIEVGGFYSVVSLAYQGGYLYAVDYSGHHVSKYGAATGAFQGSIGRIQTSPTGGVAGCAGATVGTATPGWCTGGQIAAWGYGDGMFRYPIGISAPADGFLYVSDYYNQRVQKFNATTGAFVGWIGMVGTSPTGGAPGCAGLQVGKATPGWCTGGTGGVGDGVDISTGNTTNPDDGTFANPYALSVGPDGFLYVAEYSNYRIQKFSAATGAFQGWIGTVNTTPTGGDAGCTSAVYGDFSPGWCTGGSSIYGSTNGGFSGPVGISAGYNGSLYVSDASDTLRKYSAATGQLQGWRGGVLTTPTGGDWGCTSAAPGDTTPGWCLGGSGSTGTGMSMFRSSYQLFATDFDFLYVTDYSNQRIHRIPE